MNQADAIVAWLGNGGAQAPLPLRQHYIAGTVVILGHEPEPPYERLPLCTEYLAREKQFGHLLLHRTKVWAEMRVELLLGRSLKALDRAAVTRRSAVAMQPGDHLCCVISTWMADHVAWHADRL